jgi:GIY-YIG catalytic domain
MAFRARNPCVYILASRRNGTFYIGVTSDLPQRVTLHKQDLIEGFTKKYGVHRLVYSLNERCGALCMGPVPSAHGALRRRPARDDVGEGELLSTNVIPAPAASVARGL